MNLLTLEDTINEIIDMIPYAFEYYLNVLPDDEFDDKTADMEKEESEEEDDNDDNDSSNMDDEDDNDEN